MTVSSYKNKIVYLNKSAKMYSDKSSILDNTVEQLKAYQKGKLTNFDLPIEILGTSYTKKVLKQLLNIKYGETIFYSDIANKIGSSPRAVGNACGRNNLLFIIPCHRVINKDLSIGGYSLNNRINLKSKLIELEKKTMKNKIY
ncbi:methylated-DNA--[protein]-cysteine S-methyltransferase [Alphaproteobacteria bacterium]|nr:methylated-DNA--[protein]-cysteine S-methyltransferase [Alphaproteobacteria bacterium]